MPRQKTSKAKIYTIRLNPIHLEDAEVIRIFEHWQKEGYNPKQVIVDRVLRCDNNTPEMFNKETGITADSLSTMFEQFADELLSRIGERFRYTPLDPTEDEPDNVRPVVSDFTNNFTRNVLQRRQQGLGQVDDE